MGFCAGLLRSGVYADYWACLRSIIGRNGDSLTVFLKDTTHYPEPENGLFCTGFMTFCDRVLGEEFFIATVYKVLLGYWAQTPRTTASRRWEQAFG